VKRHRGSFTSVAVLAAVVAVPVMVTAYRLTRPSDYRRCREFRSIVGDYLI
jgi:hypothetical protein